MNRTYPQRRCINLWLLVCSLALITCMAPLGWSVEVTPNSAPSGAASEVLHLLNGLDFPQDVDVKFVQQQLNPLIKNVSEQSGVMSKTTSQGLLMRITSPRFEERTLHNGTITLKRKKMSPRNTGNEYLVRSTKLDISRPSHLVLLALEAFLQGQIDILDSQFEMLIEYASQDWQITLIPKDPGVRQQLTHLLFFGSGQQLKRFRSERINAQGELSHWLDIQIEPPT